MSSDSEYSSCYATPEPVISTLPPSHPWQNDHAFGVIHPFGCKVCRDFMGHVVTASQSLDSSFQQAIKERDSRLTVRFLDGVREGRRLQREHNQERLTRYRNERSSHHARILDLEEELRRTKDRLLALEIAYDEVSQVDHLRSFSDVGDDSSEDFSILDMQSVLFASSPSEGSSVLHSSDCNEHSESVPLQLLPPNPTSDLGNHHADIPAVVCVPSTISCDWSCVQQNSESDCDSPERAHSDDGSSDNEAPTDSSDDEFSVPPPFVASESVATDLPSTSSPEEDEVPEDLETLKTLMATAHEPSNTKELARVRVLCSRAHRTPRNRRTDLQKYLLLSWRSPSLTNSLPLPTESVSRRIACEVFVDASKIGIGFISNGRWHAWKLISGWKMDGRDTSWAEMVAVELGLRTLVAGGYQSADITMRSDNGGVVNSLHSKSARNPKESIILQEILSLCKAYDIRLIPKWISTKQNPADDPSRGVYPSRLLLFPTSPPLPSHLLSFVQPVLV